jgi:nitroimidazol reductase NimA-like FMN-containing flavoprotein (pyridoxamine 5'-phosphate oxidase superfamily)
MRRSDRETSREEALDILAKAEYGVLSTVGSDGSPYGVPLSFVVIGEDIYFHGAATGHKLDNIAHESRVSFCAAEEAEAFYYGDFSTTFESAIVFGKAVLVEDPAEKEKALTALCVRYVPEHADKAAEAAAKAIDHTAIIKLSIEHITGKRRVRSK